MVTQWETFHYAMWHLEISIAELWFDNYLQ